jgi:CspA family cold shock protein
MADTKCKAEGTVKWFDKKKGYGFILETNGSDVFVHYTSFADPAIRTLNEGEKVAFDIVQGEKGPRAQNLTRKDSH